MRRTLQHYTKGVALLGTLALVLAACSSSTTPSSSGSIKTGPGVDTATKTITLGVLTPESGLASIIGKPLTEGQQAYFDNLNATGGIDGWKVKLVVEDNKYDPQTQVQVYDQIAGNVLFMAQSLGSPTTQAIESLATAQNVLLGTAAQDSAFVTQKINAVVGTPYAEDVANSLYYVTHTLGHGNAKVGIVYQNDAYGGDGLRGYTAALNAYHFDDVGHATYNVTDTELTSQALAMKNAGAQYVVVTAIPTSAALLIGAAAVIGYHPQWILQGPAWSEYLITSDGTPTGTKTPVAAALTGAWVLGFEAQWGDTSVPGMAAFLAAHDKYEATQVPDGYFMYGYALSIMEKDVLAKAIAAGDLTRAGILNAKLHLGTVDFGGLIPTATYTPSLGPADRETDIAQVDPTVTGLLKVIQPYFESSAAKGMAAS
ncbi:MAG TPA: ABC transporter substrate-binding protein [Acidimicrobiales bacterium]|nr:ABC transporter substrate-binding protein [Acidimicrobiales bacterium]